MKLNLPANVSSPQDLKAIILEIRQYAHWLGQYAIKKRVSNNSKSDAPPAISQTAVTLIEALTHEKQLSQAGLDELIASLETLAATAPRLTITLAAPPAGSLKKTLVTWCRQHIGPNVLVDFRFNSTLLGGMVVRYGSHVYDWSFRRQILAARGRFPEVLRRV
jgi:hypothetical protein